MKRLILFITSIIILGTFSYKITHKNILDIFLNEDYKIINNEVYYQKENVKNNYSGYLKYLDSDIVNNNDEIYSMMYTILNNGYDTYSFDCSYNCFSDIEKIDS
jgi:hypothetical protein